MTPPTDCQHNTDPLKLVREGTSQDQRRARALDPGYAPVDQHAPAHRIVFAQAYAAYLKYFNRDDVAAGDWVPFFSEDVSALLAVAAVQDVEYYKANLKEYFHFLKNLNDQSDEQKAKNYLGYLFSCLGTLASRLDVLKEKLPEEISLKGTLKNLITGQLAPAFKKLLLYYRDGLQPDPPPPPDPPYFNEVTPGLRIVGATAATFKEIMNRGLSQDWLVEDSAGGWAEYLLHISDLNQYPTTGIYGSGTELWQRINHLATHNLFTAIFDQFLKVFARTISAANLALEKTLTDWDRHEPHYGLFLAFLRLFEYARTEMNTLTGRHLDFYYRKILQLREKAAIPGKAHLLVELTKQAQPHLIPQGELFKAGKDDRGIEAFFACDREAVVNRAQVAALKSLYRYGGETLASPAALTDKDQGRIYASPEANSDDGKGAPLTAADQSWPPFANKIYQDGALASINMPEAEVGFAIASHYLLMAEGTRWIVAAFEVSGDLDDLTTKISCHVTSAKGWIEKEPQWFSGQAPATEQEPFTENAELTNFVASATPVSPQNQMLWLVLGVDGNDPPITPYVPKTHGYALDTNLPVLLVKLKHQATDAYAYASFQDTLVTRIELGVYVENLKTLAVSNDFGPVDTSKPFQPYGASPTKGNAWIIGSKEVFQKKLLGVKVNVDWLTAPAPYSDVPDVEIFFLNAGQWEDSGVSPLKVDSSWYDFLSQLDRPVVDEPDFSSNEFYGTASRQGFVRFQLTGDFGQSQYQTDLLNYLHKLPSQEDPPDGPPVGPSISSLRMEYIALQPTIDLSTADADAFATRPARFFHLAPFGQAEQHPRLNAAQQVYLFPQFDFQRGHTRKESEAELYIGVKGLEPPQNLALLFQVADGTADPQAHNPKIHWSYLRGNEWIAFAENEVADETGGLLNPGIITFAVPRQASDANTLLPAGMHWLRAAVDRDSDGVCRLLRVAAQALEAVFQDRDNDPAFPAKVLAPGTIKKLDRPAAAVKKINQPFPTFGGRGQEAPEAFYTRVSERLRHKDRAIALWDYERLVLEGFPQIHRVKCLNHTHYEPDAKIYRELAPGHVTVVTIPDQQFHQLRDPLRPYTSLGWLDKIHDFLKQRQTCFGTLHVKNPEFEEVQVECKVRFAEGRDEGFSLHQMQEDITRFLSPWAFPGGGSPGFGGKISKSRVIKYVEELPYVDYVTDFKLFHAFLDLQGNPQSLEKTEVEGSKAVSILVSARQDKHNIIPINPAAAAKPGEQCGCKP